MQPTQAQNQPAKQPGGGDVYALFAGQPIAWLYRDGHDAAVKLMQVSPEEGMARIVSRMLMMSLEAARMAGKKIPPNVIVRAAMEMGRAVSDIAQQQGILSRDNEADTTEAAVYRALEMFAQEADAESLTGEDRQSIARLIDAIEQARGGTQ